MKQVKPQKPCPDFPLFPHATGRWAKKVRGRMCYFGPWNDPHGAVCRWLEQKEDLLAGRQPLDSAIKDLERWRIRYAAYAERIPKAFASIDSVLKLLRSRRDPTKDKD